MSYALPAAGDGVGLGAAGDGVGLGVGGFATGAEEGVGFDTGDGDGLTAAAGVVFGAGVDTAKIEIIQSSHSTISKVHKNITHLTTTQYDREMLNRKIRITSLSFRYVSYIRSVVGCYNHHS